MGIRATPNLLTGRRENHAVGSNRGGYEDTKNHSATTESRETSVTRSIRAFDPAGDDLDMTSSDEAQHREPESVMRLVRTTAYSSTSKREATRVRSDRGQKHISFDGEQLGGSRDAVGA